jgi:hypothetical protein
LRHVSSPLDADARDGARRYLLLGVTRYMSRPAAAATGCDHFARERKAGGYTV